MVGEIDSGSFREPRGGAKTEGFPETADGVLPTLRENGTVFTGEAVSQGLDTNTAKESLHERRNSFGGSDTVEILRFKVSEGVLKACKIYFEV